MKYSATWTGKMLESSFLLYACRCSISSFSSDNKKVRMMVMVKIMMTIMMRMMMMMMVMMMMTIRDVPLYQSCSSFNIVQNAFDPNTIF